MRVGIVGGSLSGIMAGIEMKTIDPRVEVVIFEQNDKLLSFTAKKEKSKKTLVSIGVFLTF